MRPPWKSFVFFPTFLALCGPYPLIHSVALQEAIAKKNRSNPCLWVTYFIPEGGTLIKVEAKRLPSVPEPEDDMIQCSCVPIIYNVLSSEKPPIRVLMPPRGMNFFSVHLNALPCSVTTSNAASSITLISSTTPLAWKYY